jgi:hypothetical protein
MQELIGDVLQREKERLVTVAQSHLTDEDVAALNSLLANPGLLSGYVQFYAALKVVFDTLSSKTTAKGP